MNRKVGPLGLILALLAIAGVLYGAYRYSFSTTGVEHPGASDIPPKQAGDDKPAPPPPGEQMPGRLKR